MISGIVIAVSLLINICAWILEAVAVATAFKGIGKAQTVFVIIGALLVTIGAVFVRTLIAPCIGAILIGIAIIIISGGKRVLNATVALLFLSMDVGAVYLIRMLFLGDNSSIPIAIASSTLAVMVSLLVTTMRTGILRIQEGKFKVNLKPAGK